MKMTASAHQRRAPERPQPEAAALVQADALRDHLRQHRVVVEAVRRDDLAAVPVDVDGALVATARRRRSRSPRRRPSSSAGSATVIGCRRPSPSATCDRGVDVGDAAPPCPRLRATAPPTRPAPTAPRARGCAAATRRGSTSGRTTAPGSVLHSDEPRSVASSCTFAPQRPVHGSPETSRSSSPTPDERRRPAPCRERSRAPGTRGARRRRRARQPRKNR